MPRSQSRSRSRAKSRLQLTARPRTPRRGASRSRRTRSRSPRRRATRDRSRRRKRYPTGRWRGRARWGARPRWKSGWQSYWGYNQKPKSKRWEDCREERGYWHPEGERQQLEWRGWEEEHQPEAAQDPRQELPQQQGPEDQAPREECQMLLATPSPPRVESPQWIQAPPAEDEPDWDPM